MARSGRVGALLALAAGLPAAEPLRDIGLIVGAPGEPQYADGFAAAAAAWQQAAAATDSSFAHFGEGAAPTEISDRERLQAWIEREATTSERPLWLVFVGHGSFDGRSAWLNLPGPDVSAEELATWLAPVARPLVFIHGGSASAPFLSALSGPNRIIITATSSAQEVNYARFGERFAAAISNPAADLDQDGQTSLLEAFVMAAQQVQAFYAENNRLATEHALLDDNGDGFGTPAEWFRGTRLQRKPEGGRAPDGDRARLLALIPTKEDQQLTADERRRRDQWERELITLRNRKKELPEDQYYRELERILRELAPIYREDS